MKCNNIHIIGVPGRKREQGIVNLSEEIMAEDFPNLVKEKGTSPEPRNEKKIGHKELRSGERKNITSKIVLIVKSMTI